MQGESHDPNQSERQSKKMILQKKNINQFIQTKRNSFASIIAVYGVASAMALTVPVSMSVTNADDLTGKNLKSETEVVYNQKENIVELAIAKQEIVPGESAVQKEERETKEKAVAEEQSKIAQAKLIVAKTKTYTSHIVYADPSDFDQIYMRAEAAYGVDWRLLKAVHYVETGCSGSTTKSSYAGATGPMQFLPSTWRHYGVDGNGDGRADITNVEDAIFAAARYLSACGYPNIQKALWGYNPSTSYYNKVMGVARSLGL